MKIDNYIEVAYNELTAITTMNSEFYELYNDIQHVRLREILATLHHEFMHLFRSMNQLLPTGDYEAHYWADASRRLIRIIEVTLSLYHSLDNSELAFEIDEYYSDLISKCRDFLSLSGGSKVPPGMAKIDLYYVIPLFTPKNIIVVDCPQAASVSLRLIGTGSYANVYKYKDTFYDRNFALKRAKKNMTPKELIRFRLEFDKMKELSSPYILEVYNYNDAKNEYIMELMDHTLLEYIQKNNSSMEMVLRRSLVSQILRAFDYVHAKGMLHRDISCSCHP